MQCRSGCGACCIVPSITSPIPGMPAGKPAGIRCVQLDELNLCRLFGQASRPAVCSQFRATEDVCGQHNEEAFELLNWLEDSTSPDPS